MHPTLFNPKIRTWRPDLIQFTDYFTVLSFTHLSPLFYLLEKEMAAHSSVLAWRLPGVGAWRAAVCGVAQSRTRLK